jgi:hypothetical protein
LENIMELVHPVAPIPFPLWGQNLRKIMKQGEWKTIRKSLIEERGLTCETCGKVIEKSRDIKTHEDWVYDISKNPAVAHLTKLILSCWHCHAIEHFGATKNMVASGLLSQRAIDETISHFCNLNKATPEEFRKHHDDVFEIWSQMNELNWIIDWGPFSDWVAATFQGDPMTTPRRTA